MSTLAQSEAAGTSQKYVLPLLPNNFIHRRKDAEEVELPQGKLWKEQLEKYCPRGFPVQLGMSFRPHELPYVFCHRGFYDKARGIPENSHLAIPSGTDNSLHLQEIDVRIGANERTIRAIAAYDTKSNRTTAETCAWASLTSKEATQKRLVLRAYDRRRKNFSILYHAQLSSELHVSRSFWLVSSWS